MLNARIEFRALKMSHDKLSLGLNKQERFSRRNNLRIVGFPYKPQENCIEIATEIFQKIGLDECSIEKAHRDGRQVGEKPRHLLVKTSFYQDKVQIFKNARNKLQHEKYYIIDDLTMPDLSEKKKWKQEVATLYQRGIKLHFSGVYGARATVNHINLWRILNFVS